ncbi:MAG: ABC transporter substrate-binding protein, partial [Rhodobacteraceae bacterium]|nr:ABC transporter substrate-binding protein [Paracoccaceae bacterium]
QYGDPGFKQIMADLANATDPEKRLELLQAAQKKIADDYVNAYLFQLARTGVANAKLKGIWPNSPTQANDMTGVYWEE